MRQIPLRERVKQAFKRGAALAKRAASRQLSRRAPQWDGPLICVAMVRNEIDILDLWLSHLLALFDRVVIHDHRSTDGTRARLLELAAHQPALEVRLYDGEAYIQSELMTATFHEIAASTPAGWLFFLDADEFLLIRSREALRALLRAHRGATTVRAGWINAHAVVPGAVLDAGTRVAGWHLLPRNQSKIAVNLALAEGITRIDVGNHSVRFNAPPLLRNVDILRILHLPVRSEAQVRAKVALGYPAAASAYPGTGYAAHWKLMGAQEALDDLRFCAFNYGAFDRAGLMRVAPPRESLDAPIGTLVALEPGKLSVPHLVASA